MSATYDLYMDSINILMDGDPSASYRECREVMEDATSPVTNHYVDSLYNQIVKKGHINFDDIPLSKGNITAYSGYESMCETLRVMQSLKTEGNVKDVMNSIQTVQTAIQNMSHLTDLYERGYREKNEYVIMEYQLFVYCCVEATTSILSEYVEFIKGFDSNGFEIKLRNTKYRANKLYVEQLDKFNSIVSSSSYRNYLQAILDKGRANFVGATLVGVGTVAITALVAVVPVSRRIAYQILRIRTKLSDALMLQVYFLEMNKACIEANKEFDKEKKEKILKKQLTVQGVFYILANKLKVDNARAERESNADIKKDNGTLSLGDAKAQANNDDYGELL